MKPVHAAVVLTAVVASGVLAGRASVSRDSRPPSPVVDSAAGEDRAERDRLRTRVAELETALAAAAAPPRAADPVPAKAAAAPGSEPLTQAQIDKIMEEVAGNLWKEIHARDKIIGELRAEGERQKAALPDPQVLRELRRGDLAELIHLAGALRTEIQGRLLAPPDHLKSEYAEFLRRSRSGTARILHRGRFDHVVEKRGGGAYWSFASGDNSYDREPDLELQQGNFSSGFYGHNDGWLLPLGETPVDQVGTAVQAPPPGLSDRQRTQWEFLWSDSAFAVGRTKPEAQKAWHEFQARAREAGLKDHVPAVAGHTYVLRSVLDGEHDLLVVFKAVEPDDNGLSLVWHVLKEWEIPKRR